MIHQFNGNQKSPITEVQSPISVTDNRLSIRTQSPAIMLLISLLFVFGCGSGSAAYKQGYAAGQQFGGEIADWGKMVDAPSAALMDPEGFLASMEASGVEMPFKNNPKQQKEWKRGYLAGYKAATR
jgi:hypothetical protein